MPTMHAEIDDDERRERHQQALSKVQLLVIDGPADVPLTVNNAVVVRFKFPYPSSLFRESILCVAP